MRKEEIISKLQTALREISSLELDVFTLKIEIDFLKRNFSELEYKQDILRLTDNEKLPYQVVNLGRDLNINYKGDRQRLFKEGYNMLKVFNKNNGQELWVKKDDAK